MNQSIQIYNGPGANNVCVQGWERELKNNVGKYAYKIETFNSSETSGLDAGNVSLVIIPDGNACLMFDDLLHLAEKIKYLMQNKTSLLCSGSGATLMADILNYRSIPIHSRYYMEKPHSFEDSENSRALAISWNASCKNPTVNRCMIYHASGPAFPIDQFEPNKSYKCRVLAQYKSDGTARKAAQSAAAILVRDNNNLCLFTGVHPEVSYKDVLSEEFETSFKTVNQAHLEEISINLEHCEEERKKMCRSWFAELGINFV